MKNLFRLTTIFLVFTMMVACEGPTNLATPVHKDETDMPQVNETATPTVAATPTKEDNPLSDLPDKIEAGIQVEYWHPWAGEMANLILEMGEQFNQENKWGIEVKVFARGDERTIIEDMEEARRNNDLPDAAALPMDYLISLAQKGVGIQNINDYIKSSLWGIPEERMASFFPIFMSATAPGGEPIGMPAYWTGYFLAYNQSWAGELEFAGNPANIEEFEAQACAAAQKNLYDGNPNTNGTGGYVFSQDALAQFSWMRAFSGKKPMGEIDWWNFSDSGNVSAGEFLYDLYMKDCSWTGRKELPYDYFATRLALFYSTRLEEILIQERVNKRSKSSDQWALIPYPSVDDKPVVLVEGIAHVILSDNPQRGLAAWEWIKWLQEPRNQARMVEVSGSFPLSIDALNELGQFRLEHPVWNQALQYLALAEVVPLTPEWQMTKDVLSDYAWQLIRFTTRREDIPKLLSSAEDFIGN